MLFSVKKGNSNGKKNNKYFYDCGLLLRYYGLW